jgi:hypothetical protein
MADPHEGAEHHADLRQPASHVAGQQGRQPDEALGDAGLVHQIAGEHEQRHGEQREVLGLGDGKLHHHGEGQLSMLEEEQGAGNADGIGDRHAGGQEEHKSNDYEQHNYLGAEPLRLSLTPQFSRQPLSLITTVTICSMAPTGTLRVTQV